MIWALWRCWAGACSGQVGREWNAFADLLLRWARDPVSLSSPLPRGVLGRESISQSTDADAATPGSVESGSAIAWDALMQSQHHM